MQQYQEFNSRQLCSAVWELLPHNQWMEALEVISVYLD
jgi:hypothetical protein